MMRRKSPPSENILYLTGNHCQTNNISKGRRGKALILLILKKNRLKCNIWYS